MNFMQVLLTLAVISCVIQAYEACGRCCQTCCYCYDKGSSGGRRGGYCCPYYYMDKPGNTPVPDKCSTDFFSCMKKVPDSKDEYSQKCSERVTCDVKEKDCRKSEWSLIATCMDAYNQPGLFEPSMACLSDFGKCRGGCVADFYSCMEKVPDSKDEYTRDCYERAPCDPEQSDCKASVERLHKKCMDSYDQPGLVEPSIDCDSDFKKCDNGGK